MPLPPPLVIPVEKKGKFSDGFALRFLCFDPRTRMAYLSDKGVGVRFWKHRMKLYALVPKPLERKEPDGRAGASGGVAIDFRKESFDANELLTFVMHGVSPGRLDRNNANDRELMNQLPNLLQVTFEDTGSAGTISTQAADTDFKDELKDHYEEGDAIGLRTNAPVSLEGDSNFFGKDRVSWQLRCPYYHLWREMLTLMRDTLINDGLETPMHGNFPGFRDPRNKLRLITLPIWLRHPFRLLTNAIVYSCIHGRMVGCNPQGSIGVCMRHCYVCITDQDVLFMSESGEAVRWLPIKKVACVEYSLTGGERSQQPYCSFVARDGLADTLFLPCDPFTRSTASTSMVTMMPHCDPVQEIKNIVYIIGKLAAPKIDETSDDADTDIDLGEAQDATLSYDPDVQLPDVSSYGLLPTAGDSEFSALEVQPVSTTLSQYCDGFASKHGRAFTWQAPPDMRLETPSVLQSHVLARRLGTPQPERQAITLRPEFQQFYFPEGDPRELGRGEGSSSTHRRERRGDGGDSGTVDDLYQPNVPVKRGSKLLNILTPDRRLLII